jgi:hypothetical protein
MNIEECRRQEVSRRMSACSATDVKGTITLISDCYCNCQRCVVDSNMRLTVRQLSHWSICDDGKLYYQEAQVIMKKY